MTSFDQLFDNIAHFNWWLIPKAGILFLLAMMIVFAFLVLRQIQLMNKVVSGTSSLPIKIMGWAGLLAAMLVFILAFLIL